MPGETSLAAPVRRSAWFGVGAVLDDFLVRLSHVVVFDQCDADLSWLGVGRQR